MEKSLMSELDLYVNMVQRNHPEFSLKQMVDFVIRNLND